MNKRGRPALVLRPESLRAHAVSPGLLSFRASDRERDSLRAYYLLYQHTLPQTGKRKLEVRKK
jgi:hypothetical protein